MMAIFEVVGVAGILPLLSVLADPDLLRTNPWLATFVRVLGLERIATRCLPWASLFWS